jgi:hypothetical protein
VHADTDPAVMLAAPVNFGFEDIVIELEEDDIDIIEPTVVREIPRPPPLQP